MSKSVLILNGPNLNLLGKRQPEIYGTFTLADVETDCTKLGNELGLKVQFKHSNAEHQLIDWIHEARDKTAAIIINPGGLTHTSVALRDAFAAVSIPFIEVHLSNVHRREPFRHHSYFSDIAVGVIAGLGSRGYDAALEYFLGNS